MYIHIFNSDLCFTLWSAIGHTQFQSVYANDIRNDRGRRETEADLWLNQKFNNDTIWHLLFFKIFFSIFIRYLAHLHFQCYTKSPPYPPTPTPLPTHSPFLALAFPCTGAYKVCQWASLSSDGPLGHLFIHMQLETRAPGYCLVHIVVPSIGLQFPLAPWVISLAPALGAVWPIQ